MPLVLSSRRPSFVVTRLRRRLPQLLLLLNVSLLHLLRLLLVLLLHLLLPLSTGLLLCRPLVLLLLLLRELLVFLLLLRVELLLLLLIVLIRFGVAGVTRRGHGMRRKILGVCHSRLAWRSSWPLAWLTRSPISRRMIRCSSRFGRHSSGAAEGSRSLGSGYRRLSLIGGSP